MSVTYGLPRPTADIDVCQVVPSSSTAEVIGIAGPGSPLHKTHRVYLRIVTLASLPHNYEERLEEIFRGSSRRLHVLVLEPHDLALSKLGRHSDVDTEDVKYLGQVVPLDLELLRARYVEEVRPYLAGPPERGDMKMDLWCQAIREIRESSSSG